MNSLKLLKALNLSQFSLKTIELLGWGFIRKTMDSEQLLRYILEIILEFTSLMS